METLVYICKEIDHDNKFGSPGRESDIGIASEAERNERCIRQEAMRWIWW